MLVTVIEATLNVYYLHSIYTFILHIAALLKVCLKKRKNTENISKFFSFQRDRQPRRLVPLQLLLSFFALSLIQPCVKTYSDELTAL